MTDGSRVGSQFGPYRLLKLLGSGGFGEVYEAEDTAMHRIVALKLLNGDYSDDAVFRERLFREARTAGRLREPHVVPIHSCGEIDGQVYIDMRMVRGVDLETVLRRDGKLDPARAVAIVRQVAAALDAAARETVIHRDVKPGNILISGTDFASLVDFGLANAAGDGRLTKTGKAVGTFDYVAPERLNGGQVDQRADVYALACVLYECLTGDPPYAQHRDLTALMQAQMTAPIPRITEQRPDLPAGFDAVIARGLAKDPDERYPSAGALATAAQDALGEPAKPTREWTLAPGPPPAPPRPRPAWARPRRRGPGRRMLIAGAIAVIAIVAITATVLGFGHRGHRAQPVAAAVRPSSTTPTTVPFPALANGRGVAVDTAGNVYAVARGSHFSDSQVLKLAPGQTAPTQLAFGDNVSDGIAVDAGGNVFTANHGLQLTGVWKLAPAARGPSLLPFGQLSRPTSVAVGRDGSVYVVDETLRQVFKLAPGATSPNRMMPTVPLNVPQGVAIDKDDNLYVVDRGEQHVLKLPAGATDPTTLPFGGLREPYGVAVDPAGNVYVSDPRAHRVSRLAAGASNATDLPFPAQVEPYGVATDGNGTIYVVDCQRSENCGNGRVLELGGPQ